MENDETRRTQISQKRRQVQGMANVMKYSYIHHYLTRALWAPDDPPVH
jgi:hypothetical protein